MKLKISYGQHQTLVASKLERKISESTSIVRGVNVKRNYDMLWLQQSKKNESKIRGWYRDEKSKEIYSAVIGSGGVSFSY